MCRKNNHRVWNSTKTYSLPFSSKSKSRSTIYVSRAAILGTPVDKSCSNGGITSTKSDELDIVPETVK